MDDEFDPTAEEDEAPPPRRRGRPPGSRNKPKEAALTADKLRALYDRVAPILTAEHKKYLKAVIDGKTNIDPLQEAQLLLRYLSLVSTEAAEWALDSKKIGKELADIFNAWRMSIKDLDDMQRRRRDEDAKKTDEQGMVDPTRESALDRFEALHRGVPEG